MFRVVLADGTGHQPPPNAARRNSIPQTLDPARFGDTLENTTGDALISSSVSFGMA
jgi:hypothetical protein